MFLLDTPVVFELRKARAGRTDAVQILRAGEALSARADAESWLTLMRANGDMTKTLRDNCGLSGKGVYVVQGARACATPLWLDAPPGALNAAGEEVPQEDAGTVLRPGSDKRLPVIRGPNKRIPLDALLD